MSKQSLIFGAMVVGVLSVVGKRTYDVVKLRNQDKNVIEIEVESSNEPRK